MGLLKKKYDTEQVNIGMRYIYSIFALFAAVVLSVACDKEPHIAIEFDPYCNLTPEFSPDAGSLKYTFTADCDWSVVCGDEWVSVVPASGTKLDGAFTIFVESHDAGEERVSHILIKLVNGSAVTIPVKQRMRERFDVEPTEAYVVDSRATTLEIDVQTNIGYSIDVPVGKSWIKLLETRSMRDDKLCFEIEENTTDMSRVAVITARDLRNYDEVIHTFTVVQSAPGDATNEILYKSNDESLVLNTVDGFGSAYALHLYDGRSGRLIFNDQVLSIPERAFADNSDISKIKLPATLRTIEDEAFENCSLLDEIDLPLSLRNIGSRAFARCSGIDTFILPHSINSLGGSIFEGCCAELVINCSVPHQQGLFDVNHWLYGSEFECVTVNGDLGKYAFYGYDPLELLQFSGGCRIVGASAFEGCDVEKVMVDDLATWCSIAFNNASANPLHRGDNLLVVGNAELTHLDVSAIKSIGSYAFYNYDNLDTVTISDDVTSIGAETFAECGLEYMYLGRGVKSVGRGAFDDCHIDQLEINFNTPNFEYNSHSKSHWLYGISVEEVIFGDDVVSIGNFALSALDVETVIIGNSVALIGSGAFAHCGTLCSVTLGCSVKQLSEHAFYECSGLEMITLPESLEVVDAYTFNGCSSLATVTIPQDVTTIGNYCFANCSSLETIYLRPIMPPRLGNTSAIPNGVEIFVPLSSIAEYREADGWMRFSNVIQGY